MCSHRWHVVQKTSYARVLRCRCGACVSVTADNKQFVHSPGIGLSEADLSVLLVFVGVLEVCNECS